MNILFYRYNLSRKLDNSLILSDVNNNNNRCNNITNINDNNNIKIININNIYYILDITNDKIIPTSFQELEKYNTTINKNIVKIDNNYFEIDIKNNKVYNIDLVSEPDSLQCTDFMFNNESDPCIDLVPLLGKPTNIIKFSPLVVSVSLRYVYFLNSSFISCLLSIV